ncbi:MAG: carboxylating nicotinate-nucleotide diphosphorylase [Planctomycetota bacterium]
MSKTEADNQGPPALRRYVSDAELDRLIAIAKAEDLGKVGDVTSLVMIEEAQTGEAAMVARQPGVLAGGALLWLVALAYDEAITVKLKLEDGSAVQPGDTVATLSGPTRGLLGVERVALNLACHLSGVATLTARFVEAVAGTKAKVCDTRKTLPGLRGLQKYAVRCGGGTTHRTGLHDALLIKDNHVAHLPLKDWPKTIRSAIKAARKLNDKLKFAMVEVDTLDQLEVALQAGPDIVLLDNFDPAGVAEAVAMRDKAAPGVQLEASGGVNLDTARPLAEAGVDRLSIGALTHSAPALDLGLDLKVD